MARKLTTSLLLAVAWYVLLLAVWPVARHVYTPYYCMVHNALFHQFGTYGGARFKTIRPAQPDHEVQAVLTAWSPKLGRKIEGNMTYPLRVLAYMPTITLLALVLATPLTRKRMLWALLGGVTLITAFVALRTAIKLWLKFEEAAPQLSAGGLEALRVASGALIDTPGSHYTAAILIWALVCFRREDARRLLRMDRQAP